MPAPTVSNKSGKNYIYSIPASSVTITGHTGFVVETAELDTSAQVNDTAIGETGLVEGHAVGGEGYTLSVSGYCVGTQPPIGTKVTISNIMGSGSSHVGLITSIKPSIGNRAFKKFALTANGFEGITYA